MPDDSRWLGDVLAVAAFLLGLTCYGLRMVPPAAPREPPQIPVEWDKTGPIIGIDIGRTYARVGLVVSEHRIQIFRHQQGSSTLDADACLALQDDLAGSADGDQSPILPPSYSSVEIAHHLFGPEDSPVRPSIPLRASAFPTPRREEVCLDITATLLRKLRVMAENFHGSRISQAVIAIPGHYTEKQRAMIQEAARLAGLSPVRLLDQAVAIAVAYGLDRRRTESYAFVLDVGSTTRATLLHVNNGDAKVVSSVQQLGGDAVNHLLIAHAVEAYRYTLSDELNLVQRLVLEDQVETAKIKLSKEEHTVIALPIQDGPWFLVPLPATKFNSITANLIDDIVGGTIEEVLRTAQVVPGAIDDVILAGGSAHIPALQRYLARSFPGTIPLSTGERYPDDAVVYGASLFARRLALGQVPDESKIYVQNATPMRFGIEVAGGLFATLIPRNSPLPVKITRRLNLPRRSIRIFTGMAEYTNATEFIGSVQLPPSMNTTRLKITIELNTYGVLNVSAVDSAGRSHAMLLEPRRPSGAEIARMEAEAAALADRADLMRRMQTFRAHVAHSLPVLTQQLRALAADHPKRALRAKVVDTLTALDIWMTKYMLSASRERFLAKLAELEEVLRQDLELGNGLSVGVPGKEAE
ncbi:Hsp70 protein-domain-containing protein [Mycena leptocephala]|nr:Hsp70 protein-domain-containing protein [Mycena leptocephala]